MTNRYLNGVPEDSRASRSDSPFLSEENVVQTIDKVKKLNDIAAQRGQTLAEMAIAWILRDGIITSVLVGASRLSQLQDNVKALDHLDFTTEELTAIDAVIQ